MYRTCEEYPQPRRGWIYHAAHKQPRDDLLQQYPFRHRRRYLYLRHDHHLQCAPACRDTDPRHGRGNLPDPELQLRCPQTGTRAEIHSDHESPCFRLHGRHVEHDHPHPGNADPYFQLGRGADPGCGSGTEHVFCGFYLYGPPVHRSGGI